MNNIKNININFAQRRSRILEAIEKDSIILISSSCPKVRNSDANYPFRQNSDFFYLTGFDEPESLMVLKSTSSTREFILFCRDRDPLREQWDGFRAGQEGAIKDYGADISFSINTINEAMPDIFLGVKNIYYPMSESNDIEQKVNKWLEISRNAIRSGIEVPDTIISLDSILHEMRLIKNFEELDIMKEAATITAEAHCDAMRAVKPGMFEYQLEALGFYNIYELRFK